MPNKFVETDDEDAGVPKTDATPVWVEGVWNIDAVLAFGWLAPNSDLPVLACMGLLLEADEPKEKPPGLVSVIVVAPNLNPPNVGLLAGGTTAVVFGGDNDFVPKLNPAPALGATVEVTVAPKLNPPSPVLGFDCSDTAPGPVAAVGFAPNDIDGVLWFAVASRVAVPNWPAAVPSVDMPNEKPADGLTAVASLLSDKTAAESAAAFPKGFGGSCFCAVDAPKEKPPNVGAGACV